MHTPTRAALAAACALALPLASCANSGQETPSPTASSTPSAASATVAGHEVIVAEKPRRVAAVSSDVASLAAAIAQPENIAVISDIGPSTPSGPRVLKGDYSVDPEQILSAEPDLVLLTTRHGQEKDAGALVEKTNIPVAQFDGASDWSSIDAILSNVDTLGTLLGEPERAAALRAEIEAARGTAHDTTARHAQASTPAPRVLALMSRGEQRMVAPSTTLLHGLIAEAGGEPVTGNASGRGPVPADPELIASLNPDVILVEDFRGRGRADFEAILGNPSLQQVPAVAHGRIHYLPSDQVTAAGAARVGEGIAAVTDAVWGGENN